MRKNFELYKNIGVHTITSIFTVDKGVVKVLLVKRKNEPFKDMWALVGGAVYNNELLREGALREIKEKTGLEGVKIYESGIFDKLDRSPIMRMIAVTYVGIVDINKVNVLSETINTEDASWVPIDKVKRLAYDHNDILLKALDTLKELIVSTDILKGLFPNGFTIPEVQKTYEAILGKEFDRRNFRKKLLSLRLITDTGKEILFEGKRPAKLYKFDKRKENKSVF